MAPTLEPFKSEKYIPETKNDGRKTNNEKSAQNVQEEKKYFSTSASGTGSHQQDAKGPLTAPPEYSDPDMPGRPIPVFKMIANVEHILND
ncbi:hypothetical protein ASPBRDRAFT_193127 [Aspergillus brasiliensis CBS 101740]|uniref:Uncharacterized protein n=1 Tax=Aspergillus brasiliensis (strain CBS 101740 / IMI 381727 / IBT 21946) TaxID=767769 RepID=A0A1L9URU2_ASPBC|nr:hypothetical protein ASPBRDRAFT_193127 [Aspergillus brasiliensis CBS 101740]